MRTTITISDELVSEARRLTKLTENAALFQEALETLIRVESGKRLAALGGFDPTASAPDRRRQDG